MRTELILNTCRHCKQIEQWKTRFKVPSEYLNVGRLLVCIVQFSKLRIDKMKKLLKIMIPLSMMKLVGLRITYEIVALQMVALHIVVFIWSTDFSSHSQFWQICSIAQIFQIVAGEKMTLIFLNKIYHRGKYSGFTYEMFSFLIHIEKHLKFTGMPIWILAPRSAHKSPSAWPPHLPEMKFSGALVLQSHL